MSRCTGHCCDPVRLSADVAEKLFLGEHEDPEKWVVQSMLEAEWLHFPTGRMYFKCIYFDEESRNCTIYEERPRMCRDYPYDDVCGEDGCTMSCSDE